MKKIIYMVTVPESLSFMEGQFEYLENKGYSVGVISSPGEKLNNQKATSIKPIKMEREIHIVKDFKSLINIIKYFKKVKPDIVNAGTPKAGLLGMLAAFITGVPNRVYSMLGLRLETSKGLKKHVLWITEKISCFLATEIICVSPSLLKRAKDYKLVKRKGVILNKGSVNGLNIKNYPLPIEERVKKFVEEFKEKNNIDKKDFILGFVGRLTKDKGIYELVDVFEELNIKYPNIKLVIMGSFEREVTEKVKNTINNHDSIYYLGSVSDPTLYYYLFDVLVFPTHREGFGNVSIEAQAASTPVITTNATGAIDTVINNKTGLIYNVEDKNNLKSSIMKFYSNEINGKEYGKKGRMFVEKNFQTEFIKKELGELYDSFYQ